MVKAPLHNFLHVFRFVLKFYFKQYGMDGDERTDERVEVYAPKDVGATVTAVTARGFEMWRAIEPGKKLINEIGEACRVTVNLRGREDEPERIVTLEIGEPDYLPFGVGIELGGQRVGRLDATDSSIALEGVVFRKTKITFVDDIVKETGDDD